MGITNSESGTNVQEIAAGIYRINTPIALPNGAAFSMNQYLVVDDEPLLFHTGPRRMFQLVRQAVDSVLPAKNLRYLAFSHVEADECGSMNEWLALAPQAVPACGRIAALTSVEDLADRPPRVLTEDARLSLGKRSVRWFDTPHLPHGWECGLLMDVATATLLCGDLFTQAGPGTTAITESDILAPSEAMRSHLDYFAHARDTRALLEKLAQARPSTLAVMHGSAWRGDGAALLRALADALGA